jgi:putative endonuclease
MDESGPIPSRLGMWRDFFRRWFGPRGRRPLTSDEALGCWGEAQVARHYRAAGATILAQNWRHGRDELDLVVLERQVLVFVEVKTRRADVGGAGYHAVDNRKKTALRRAAYGWLKQIGGAPHRRFDVVEVMVCHRGTVRILQHRGVTLFGKRRP